MIHGRFWPVSAVSVCFSHFDRRSIQPDLDDTVPFWPNRLSLTQISENRAVLVRIQEKKKKLRRGIDAQAATSDATPRIGPHRTLVWYPPSRIDAS